MVVPIEISLQHLDDAERKAIDTLVRSKAERLERFVDYILSLRIAVSRPENRPEHHGDRYRFRVHIEVHVPKETLNVTKTEVDIEKHQTMEAGVRKAFEAIERQLREHHDKVKRHVPAADEAIEREIGTIKSLDYAEGTGWIDANDGSTVFFHESVLIDIELGELEMGQRVHYRAVSDTPHARATEVEPAAVVELSMGF